MATKKKDTDVDADGEFSMLFKADIKSKVDKQTISMIEDGLPTDVKKFISTGSTLLDYAIANRKNGGVPVGKITEISGKNSTGKTLVAMQICANGQKEGALIVYVDPEHALNGDFAKRVGLDINHPNFVHLTPSTMEDTYACMFLLFSRIREAEQNKTMNWPYVILVWDSIPASPPKQDLDSENPDPSANVGLVARIMSKNLKILLGEAGRKNVACLFLNQLRNKIGAMPGEDPYIEPGGNALPFYASVRIRLTSVGKIKTKDKTEVLGIKTKAEVRKTRFGPPFRKSEFNIFFTKGVKDIDSIIEFLEKKGQIRSVNGGRKGKLYSLKSQPKEEEMDLVQFRQKIITDPVYNNEIMELVDNLLTKDLVDPDSVEHEIEND